MSENYQAFQAWSIAHGYGNPFESIEVAARKVGKAEGRAEAFAEAAKIAENQAAWVEQWDGQPIHFAIAATIRSASEQGGRYNAGR